MWSYKKRVQRSDIKEQKVNRQANSFSAVIHFFFFFEIFSFDASQPWKKVSHLCCHHHGTRVTVSSAVTHAHLNKAPSLLKASALHPSFPLFSPLPSSVPIPAFPFPSRSFSSPPSPCLSIPPPFTLFSFLRSLSLLLSFSLFSSLPPIPFLLLVSLFPSLSVTLSVSTSTRPQIPFFPFFSHLPVALFLSSPSHTSPSLSSPLPHPFPLPCAFPFPVPLSLPISPYPSLTLPFPSLSSAPIPLPPSPFPCPAARPFLASLPHSLSPLPKWSSVRPATSPPRKRSTLTKVVWEGRWARGREQERRWEDCFLPAALRHKTWAESQSCFIKTGLEPKSFTYRATLVLLSIFSSSTLFFLKIQCFVMFMLFSNVP